MSTVRRMTSGLPSACGVCGAPIDASRAVFNNQGQLVCQPCSSKDQIAEGDKRALSSVTAAAVGVVVGGILSVTCFNPLFITSIITLASGFGWMVMAVRTPNFSTKLGSRFIPCWIMVGLGFLLAGAPLILLVLGFTAAAALHH